MEAGMLKRLLVAFVALGFVVPAFAIEETMIIPQIAHGPNWTTRIRVINADQMDTTIAVTFRKSDGTPWNDLRCMKRFSDTPESNAHGRMLVRFQAESTTELVTIPQGEQADTTGYLLIWADPNHIKVSATLQYHPSGQILSEVGVLPSPLTTIAWSPFDSSTAIAIANPYAKHQRIAVRVYLSGAGGLVEMEDYSLFLGSREQRASFITEIVNNKSASFKNSDKFFGYFAVVCLGEPGDATNSDASFMVLNFKDGMVSSAPVHGWELARSVNARP
jgi:hypothetical protein